MTASPVMKSTGVLNCNFEYSPVVMFLSSNWKVESPVPKKSAVGIPTSECIVPIPAPRVSLITFFSIVYEGIDEDAT